MAKQDDPLIEPTLAERVRGQVEDVAARFDTPAALSLGAEEIRLLLEGVEDSVRRGLGDAPTERNYAPSFALGNLFGAILALILFVAAFLLARL